MDSKLLSPAVPTLSDARPTPDELGDSCFNMAQQAAERHGIGPRRNQAALVAIDRAGAVRTLTYGALAGEVSRFANALAALGVVAGDRVALLLPRVPEAHVAVLGALELGAVVCPLFAAYGPEPIRRRLSLAGARVLVTSSELFARKVRSIRDGVPSLEHVIAVGAEAPEGTHPWSGLLDRASERHEVLASDPELPALVHFTSGTTGEPKGAVHVHGALDSMTATARSVLGLQPGWPVVAFGALVALCLAAAYVAMGAAWLIYKSEGELQIKSVRWLRWALIVTALGMAAVSLATPWASPRIFDKWFALPHLYWLLPLPVVSGALFLWLFLLTFRLPAPDDRHSLKPFLIMAAIFATGFAGLAYSFYPYVVPERLTIWEAAAAPESLGIILAGTAFVLPVIIGYSFYAYRVFGGKAGDLRYD